MDAIMLTICLVIAGCLLAGVVYLEYPSRRTRRAKQIRIETEQAKADVNRIVKNAVNEMYRVKTGKVPSWRRW